MRCEPLGVLRGKSVVVAQFLQDRAKQVAAACQQQAALVWTSVLNDWTRPRVAVHSFLTEQGGLHAR